MQYQVPQFIDIEDRIIGPLTLKQFIYLAFAAAVLFVFWFLFNFYIWMIAALPITVLAFAFAFLKINDRPFIYFFLAAVFYFIKPKLYIFGEATKEYRKETILEPKPLPVETPENVKVTSSKLKELALSLDTRK
ncbi:MAG: PrgI family protein [Parcubacteria group bacterium]|nr:PrgI family protein [Parcubacteria group bacterium]